MTDGPVADRLCLGGSEVSNLLKDSAFVDLFNSQEMWEQSEGLWFQAAIMCSSAQV